jgi:hypothetical protein
MGASQFIDLGKGKSIEDAFRKAVEDAKWEFGHGGYTGTIAEKTGYKICYIGDVGRARRQAYLDAVEVSMTWSDMRNDSADKVTNAYKGYRQYRKKTITRKGVLEKKGFNIEQMADQWDKDGDDKWGPCLGIRVGQSNQYIFWGVASQ